MAVEHSAPYERMSLDDYLALVEQDPEHAYEYLDGRVYMMTGGSPDHAIIGSNLNGLLQAFLRGRRCIVYTSETIATLCWLLMISAEQITNFPHQLLVCSRVLANRTIRSRFSES